jgi:inner membrane protease subunit 1
VQTAIITLKIICLIHLTSHTLFHINETLGPSMLPTLHVSHDHVLIDARYRRGRDIAVGDVVEFKHPVVPGEGVIKRVVGMPGDFVCIEGAEMLQVPEGHCWVEGDNKSWSRDSRTYGPLPMGLIKGRVVARVWPLAEMKWIGRGLEKIKDGEVD